MVQMGSVKANSAGKNKKDIFKGTAEETVNSLRKLKLGRKIMILKNFVSCCEFCTSGTLVLSKREK